MMGLSGSVSDFGESLCTTVLAVDNGTELVLEHLQNGFRMDSNQQLLQVILDWQDDRRELETMVTELTIRERVTGLRMSNWRVDCTLYTRHANLTLSTVYSTV